MSSGLILGLDLGTACGWALLRADGSRVASGVWDCHTRVLKRAGMAGGPVQRLMLLRGHLDDIALWGDVVTVAYEEVRAHTGTQAAHVWGALEGVVQLAAARHGWRLLPVGVGTVKRRLTGSGASRKGSMVRAACARWGLGECGEDEADALAVALAALDVVERAP